MASTGVQGRGRLTLSFCCKLLLSGKRGIA